MKQFVFLLSVVLLQAWLCAVHARQLSGVEEAGEDRLLLNIRKPDVINATDSSVSLSFYSGPNLKKVDFTFKCVNETLPCDAPAEGSPAVGTLPKVWAMVNATVTDLNPNTTYWCYILTSVTKVAKCKGPYPATTNATLTLP